MVQITIRLEDDFHRRLKVASAQRDEKLQNIVVESLHRWLEGESKPMPAPAGADQELARRFLSVWQDATPEQRRLLDVLMEDVQKQARASRKRNSA